ncbi:hypothetical protein VNO78_11602 [Psophocarpus tetragonolobus]|uniref:Uncharacterized protein n=1 Tax=Psophocarpus tetragonolobus TaxID=3891 RepID=A0AAN9SMN4_PSOTE
MNDHDAMVDSHMSAVQLVVSRNDGEGNIVQCNSDKNGAYYLNDNLGGNETRAYHNDTNFMPGGDISCSSKMCSNKAMGTISSVAVDGQGTSIGTASGDGFNIATMCGNKVMNTISSVVIDSQGIGIGTTSGHRFNNQAEVVGHHMARSCDSTTAVSKHPDCGGDRVSNPDQIPSDLGFRRCSARSYSAASRTVQIAIWIAFRLPSSRGILGLRRCSTESRARPSSTPPSVGSWLSALLRARSSDASPLRFQPPFPPPLRRVSDFRLPLAYATDGEFIDVGGGRCSGHVVQENDESLGELGRSCNMVGLVITHRIHWLSHGRKHKLIRVGTKMKCDMYEIVNVFVRDLGTHLSPICKKWSHNSSEDCNTREIACFTKRCSIYGWSRCCRTVDIPVGYVTEVEMLLEFISLGGVSRESRILLVLRVVPLIHIVSLVLSLRDLPPSHMSTRMTSQCLDTVESDLVAIKLMLQSWGASITAQSTTLESHSTKLDSHSLKLYFMVRSMTKDQYMGLLLGALCDNIRTEVLAFAPPNQNRVISVASLIKRKLDRLPLPGVPGWHPSQNWLTFSKECSF